MRRADPTRSAFVIARGAALLAGGCGQSERRQQGSIIVQLPPARPYRPAAVKPGFSQPVTGIVRA
ncbi:MAG: hypothetical protein HOP95_01215 [Sphingomonas sp.]|nr:hypothetical protein [Sphingomonas sp.]